MTAIDLLSKLDQDSINEDYLIPADLRARLLECKGELRMHYISVYGRNT